jgi:hypothetical protein
MIVKAIALCALVGVVSAADVKTFCGEDGCDKWERDIFEAAPIKDLDIQQTFELSGVKLGDTFDNSKTKIKKINPQYEISSEDGVMKGVEGKEPDDVADRFTIAKDDGGKVWLIQRYQALKGGNEIKTDVFLETVSKKYGQPSEKILSRINWYYDRDGKQIFPKEAYEQQACSDTLSDAGAVSSIPSGTCGKIISIGFETSGEFITLFNIGIADHKSMYDKKNTKKNKPKL